MHIRGRCWKWDSKSNDLGLLMWCILQINFTLSFSIRMSDCEFVMCTSGLIERPDPDNFPIIRSLILFLWQVFDWNHLDLVVPKCLALANQVEWLIAIKLDQIVNVFTRAMMLYSSHRKCHDRMVKHNDVILYSIFSANIYR